MRSVLIYELQNDLIDYLLDNIPPIQVGFVYAQLSTLDELHIFRAIDFGHYFQIV